MLLTLSILKSRRYFYFILKFQFLYFFFVIKINLNNLVNEILFIKKNDKLNLFYAFYFHIKAYINIMRY